MGVGLQFIMAGASTAVLRPEDISFLYKNVPEATKIRPMIKRTRVICDHEVLVTTLIKPMTIKTPPIKIRIADRGIFTSLDDNP